MTIQDTTTDQIRSIVGCLKRPDWVCRKVKQIGILVRDASSSMEGQKAAEASDACHGLVRKLASPENKDGFYMGVVDFADKARIVHNLTKATELVNQLTPIAPSGETNITAALQKALDLLKKGSTLETEGIRFRRPAVILLSDGCHNKGDGPENAADQLKKEADLVTVGFGSDADEALLKSLALTPQHFYHIRDGRELRHFMADVGDTMSRSIQAGIDSTDQLARMRG